MFEEPRRTFSLYQLAQVLQVSERTVRRRWHAGDIPPPVRGAGRKLRWSADAVDKVLRTPRR